MELLVLELLGLNRGPRHLHNEPGDEHYPGAVVVRTKVLDLLNSTPTNIIVQVIGHSPMPHQSPNKGLDGELLARVHQS